jgi:hypothetical protein
MSTEPDAVVPTKRARLTKAAEDALVVVLGLAMAYVIYYWGFWRGGKYLYTEVIAPYLAARASVVPGPAAPNASPGVAVEVFKLLWAVAGATLGGIAAAVVRRWFVFRALEGKVVLLDKIRIDLLKDADRGTLADPIGIAIAAGTVKYLFGEKEYINIGKYVEPRIALMLLRTISAIDMLSSTARLPQAEAELARLSARAVAELRQFECKEILANLKLLRQDGGEAVGEAAEKAAG